MKAKQPKTQPTIVITTTICGRKNYIAGFSTGMNNKLVPRYTIHELDAYEFPMEKTAQIVIDDKIAPGAKRADLKVETIHLPVKPDNSAFAMAVYLDEHPHRSCNK